MEKSLKGTKTEQNLLKAFAGESQAKNRYEFAAKVAKEEGFEQISGIFQATALQEQQQAKLKQLRIIYSLQLKGSMKNGAIFILLSLKLQSKKAL